jgi:cytochrome oxidase Cu insertion factor (SCO1/SenC/PrrC family)
VPLPMRFLAGKRPEPRIQGLGRKALKLDHSLINLAAPEFTLADADGQFLSLSDFRGRTVVLVFLRHFA